MILIYVGFLVLTWRIATSKGYPGGALVLASGIPASIAASIDVLLAPQSEPLSTMVVAAEVGIPLLVLGLAVVLPYRSNAPGAERRAITFPCPDCGASLSFKRKLEGLVRQCHRCDEIVTVEDPRAKLGAESNAGRGPGIDGSSPDETESGTVRSDLIIGGLTFVGGIAATVESYVTAPSADGWYAIAWSSIFFGAFLLIRGINAFAASRQYWGIAESEFYKKLNQPTESTGKKDTSPDYS